MKIPAFVYFCLCSCLASADMQPSTINSRHSTRNHRQLCKNIVNGGQKLQRRDRYFDLRYSFRERQSATVQAWKPRSCPDFAEYIAQSRSRSLSPYGPILDYDPGRRPRVIIHQACLCQHCFSPATLEPNYNLIASNITTSIEVVYSNGHSTKYNVVTGCTCVVSSTRRI